MRYVGADDPEWGRRCPAAYPMSPSTADPLDPKSNNLDLVHPCELFLRSMYWLGESCGGNTVDFVSLDFKAFGAARYLLLTVRFVFIMINLVCVVAISTLVIASIVIIT